MGKSRLKAKGYRLEPTTLLILFMKLLSYPSKGIYMKDPAITSVLFNISR